MHNRLGCRVIASARRPEALADLIALGMEAVVLDVDDEASVQHAVESVASLTGGKLDILVNNAYVHRLFLQLRCHADEPQWNDVSNAARRH